MCRHRLFTTKRTSVLILLAIDDVGWTNIVQLSNLGQLCGGDWRGPRIDWRDLSEPAEG
jgi:hypothetical protein